jgi:hypothetical protein
VAQQPIAYALCRVFYVESVDLATEVAPVEKKPVYAMRLLAQQQRERCLPRVWVQDREHSG